jgi:heme-degrading monooxygenase HmoA
MNVITKTPKSPYYAVIFTSQQNDDHDGYEVMSEKMLSLVSQQTGFLGAESVRGLDQVGITVSYWDSLESIKNWKQNLEHQVAQKNGKERWYKNYRIRIARVEKEYGMGG